MCRGGKGQLRIASWNCSSFYERRKAICDCIHDLRLDVLVLQEVWLPAYMHDNMDKFFRSQGITMVVSKEKRDSSGAVTGGVMVLSRWAITVEAIHDAYIDQHAVVVNLERKGAPPISIAGVYLSASSHPRVLLGIETLLNVRGLRDHLIIGDFNLTPDDDPVAMRLARGRFLLGNVAGGRALVPCLEHLWKGLGRALAG